MLLQYILDLGFNIGNCFAFLTEKAKCLIAALDAYVATRKKTTTFRYDEWLKVNGGVVAAAAAAMCAEFEYTYIGDDMLMTR